MNKLFIVVNEDRFFLSHRLPVAKAAKEKGYEVTIIAKDTGSLQEIKNLGFDVMDMPINPTGMNPLEEGKTFNFLFHLYNKENPDIVHHVGLKNILWGSMAAKMAKVKGVVNAFSGLGGLFNGDKISTTAAGILKLLRFSNSKKRVKAIFQNQDDYNIILKHKAIQPQQAFFTNGSGIDLNDYSYSPPKKDDKVQVIFTGRMVQEKGVYDLIEAANILKHEYKDKTRFTLCGRLTPNKTGVNEDYLKMNCDGEYINWLGERNDIKSLLIKSHIMVFPSYYREGIPKSLIEASAIGRPIITCDSVGCREVVKDGMNGFLITPKSPKELAEALKILIDNPHLREKMGKLAREKAEKDFSIEKVVETHLEIYNSFVNKQK